MKSVMIASLLAGAAITVATPAHAATVLANNTTLTDLGSFAAGTYTITATGVVGLAGPPGSGSFDLGPDGVPVVPVTSPGYGYCNPTGCDSDVFSGGAFGPGGAGRNLGSLLGALVASPSGPSSYFAIGNGTTVTLGSAGNIYALVNDTFYPNNGGSFSVTVNQAAVPEPATWALMIGGFGMVGGSMRYRRRKTSVSFS